MTKRIFALIIALFMCFTLTSTVFALEDIGYSGDDDDSFGLEEVDGFGDWDDLDENDDIYDLEDLGDIVEDVFSVPDEETAARGFVYDDMEKLAESEIAELNDSAKNIYMNKGVAVTAILTDQVGETDAKEYVVSRLAENGMEKNAVALLLDFGANSVDVFASGSIEGNLSQTDLDELATAYSQSENVYDGIGSYINGVLLRLNTRGARVVDRAELLTANELENLREKANRVSERLGFDIVVVTVDSLEGKSPEAYADDFFDYNGYGYNADNDGILFLVSMEERDWAISTSGYGITAFTDAGQEKLIEAIKPDLSAGRYYDCFGTFIDKCDDYVTQARTDHPYDVDDYKAKPGIGSFIFMFLESTGIGSLVSNASMKSVKRSYKTVKKADTANHYAVNNSLRLQNNDDMFLYKNVTRSARVVMSSSGGGSSRPHYGGSSTHTSSSGHTHGGSHGKF